MSLIWLYTIIVYKKQIHINVIILEMNDLFKPFDWKEFYVELSISYAVWYMSIRSYLSASKDL